MQDLLENTRFNSWSNWLHILLLLERYWRTLNINHTVWSMLSLVVWTFSCLLGKQETKWLIRKFQPPWGHQSNLYGFFFFTTEKTISLIITQWSQWDIFHRGCVKVYQVWGLLGPQKFLCLPCWSHFFLSPTTLQHLEISPASKACPHNPKRMT